MNTSVAPGTPATQADDGVARSRRVLVVDDSADVAELLADLLSSWGHHAVHALDGLSALALVVAFRPDVVLLDIGLPELDGYEVARRLRRIPEIAEARIVAVTGHCDAADRARAREAGFDDHLVKPFDLEKLRLAVEWLRG